MIPFHSDSAKALVACALLTLHPNSLKPGAEFSSAAGIDRVNVPPRKGGHDEDHFKRVTWDRK